MNQLIFAQPPSTPLLHVLSPGWFSSSPFSLAARNVSLNIITSSSCDAASSTLEVASFDDVRKDNDCFLDERVEIIGDVVDDDGMEDS